MYQVNAASFDSFLAAVAAAKTANAEVFETATGLRRWAPAVPVSSRRARMYREQMAAHQAQQAAK